MQFALLYDERLLPEREFVRERTNALRIWDELLHSYCTLNDANSHSDASPDAISLVAPHRRAVA